MVDFAFDQINVVDFAFDQIKPEDMRAFFVPPGKGVYFHPGEKTFFGCGSISSTGPWASKKLEKVISSRS